MKKVIRDECTNIALGYAETTQKRGSIWTGATEDNFSIIGVVAETENTFYFETGSDIECLDKLRE